MGLDPVAVHCSPEERLMLDTIRQHLVSADSLDQIMERVFATIPHEPGVRMALAFLDDPGGRVTCQWTEANYRPTLLPDNYEEDLVDSLMEEAYRRSEAVKIDDLEAFACQHPFNQGAVKRVREGLRTCIVAPVRVGARVIGFLIRSSKSPKPVDARQVRIQQAIADGIGPVVEKAYRIQMLTRANHRYSETLAFISHELQSPIASMVTDARLLAEGYLGELNEAQLQKVRHSAQKGEAVLRMIRSFLNVARLESGALLPQMSPAVNLKQDVVLPEIELLESELEEHAMGVQCSAATDLPPAECDPALLRIAVGNLLRNAIKYGLDGRDIRVTLEHATQSHVGGALTIRVWNAGPGFSEAQRALLFRKFSRLESPGDEKTNGTGIGLYSASRIMHLHHGLATAHSCEGQWAEFQLTLPLKQPALVQGADTAACR